MELKEIQQQIKNQPLNYLEKDLKNFNMINLHVILGETPKSQHPRIIQTFIYLKDFIIKEINQRQTSTQTIQQIKKSHRQHSFINTL